MRTVYAKSNTGTFSHCSTDVKVTLFQTCQLGPRYEGQLTRMAEPIPPSGQSSSYSLTTLSSSRSTDRRAETDRMVGNADAALRTVVAQHCISRFSGVITRNQHLGRFVLLFVRRIEKSLVFPKRSSASAMYAQHNVCIFETTILKSIYMILCRD